MNQAAKILTFGNRYGIEGHTFHRLLPYVLFGRRHRGLSSCPSLPQLACWEDDGGPALSQDTSTPKAAPMSRQQRRWHARHPGRWSAKHA